MVDFISETLAVATSVLPISRYRFSLYSLELHMSCAFNNPKVCLSSPFNLCPRPGPRLKQNKPILGVKYS